MNRKIKLIWEFSGPDAEKIAKHHTTHLEEFGIREKLELSVAGNEYINHISWIAYLIVLENEVITARDALKPLRAEIFED